MPTTLLENRAEIVRGFNRFYTRQIGVLNEHLLGSEFSLTESRILYELAHRDELTSSDLSRELNLNAGYLSRVIAGFEKKELLAKTRSSTDSRVSQLQLTGKGRATFEPLSDASRREVIAMIERLSDAEQQLLVASMCQIQELLSDKVPSYLLRDPVPGDMGWIVHQNGALYANEYGWNTSFEALVAEIVAQYIRDYDPQSDRCWIAEKDGRAVGSVFVVRHDENTAKLRLLYVDASARGLGIGNRLVDECLRFVRHVGYQRVMLWTNSVLTDARKIYEKSGFQLIDEEPHQRFGQELMGQTWALDL